MFSIQEIHKALTRHAPAETRFQADRNCAAVAMVLAGSEPDLQLCVIRRVQKSGDPWSGHMAFPGGRASPQDASLQETAERETHEEVGLVLERSHRLGGLSEISIRLSGRDKLLFLSPFVYYVGQHVSALTVNHEVADAHWMPLAHPWDEKNGTYLSLSTANASLLYPAIRYREQIIWGITLRVLTLFSDVLGRPLPHLEEIPGLGHA